MPTDLEVLQKTKDCALRIGARLDESTLRITFATGRTWKPSAATRSAQIRDAWHVCSRLISDPDPAFRLVAVAVAPSPAPRRSRELLKRTLSRR